MLMVALAACHDAPREEASATRVADLLGSDRMGAPQGDWAMATSPGAISLPRDHAAHPDYRAEWWYVTGNLEGDEGRFGFQLTIFRFGLGGRYRTPLPDASQWRADDVYMAHLAVTDIARASHTFAERFSRGAAGLAGAVAEPVRIWLEDWSIEGGTDLVPARLRAAEPSLGIGIDLELSPGRPAVFHGQDGLSQKGDGPGNASYYYSYTRLPAAGKIRSGGVDYDVDGLAWIDREWGSSALGKGRRGWHWLSLQMDDGRDLMLYVIRMDDGTKAAQSSGTLVSPDGSATWLSAADFSMTPVRRWSSPATGSTYPVSWEVRVPAHGIDLAVTAVVDDQEQTGIVTYWEGAVDALPSGGGPEAGRGYLELTGY